ncbi:MAG: NYN domain-containing protein [Candidatus Eisenbacteria bacterium]|nr:NYN domain-containing protein [Candidatus Eisenbacteria bacterium]
MIDGFNLYHSLDKASGDLGGAQTKWLDLIGLCSNYLPQIGNGAEVESVHYFSAPAGHVEQAEPGALDRHWAYIRAIESTGVTVELGNFKAKQRKCPHCQQPIVSHEEKETDVAIAVRLLDLLWSKSCDAVAVVSADSDLSPAIRLAMKRFPGTQIYCLFPYGRGSFDLHALATKVIRLRSAAYRQHQLPDPVGLPDGSIIAKPSAW